MPKCLLTESAKRADRRRIIRRRITEYISGKMKTSGKNQAELGEVLGISQPAFGHRLRKGLFETDELIVLFEVLDAPLEDLTSLAR